MIPWLREKPTRSGVRLRVGGYLPPFRARVFMIVITLVTFVVGFLLALALIANDKAGTRLFEKWGIPGWIYSLGWLLPMFLPALFYNTRLGQFIGEILIGSRFTIIITKDYLQIIRWFVYRPKYPLGPGIAFEHLPHPKAEIEVLGNELRRAPYPRNPGKAVRFDEYKKAGVVVYRCGSRVVRLANIYDRRPAGLGHKADRLVHTLQRLHNEAQGGNRSTATENTPLQYGSRPSLA